MIHLFTETGFGSCLVLIIGIVGTAIVVRKANR